MTQIYFDPKVSNEEREIFNKIEEVFVEDVKASEKQKVPYVPYVKSTNQLEEQVVVFGNWIKNNRIHSTATL